MLKYLCAALHLTAALNCDVFERNKINNTAEARNVPSRPLMNVTITA